MAMFMDSRQLDFETILDSCQTSSSAARPARTRARRTATVKGSKAAAQGCFFNGPASSPSADRFGHALRTCLASELEASTGCSSSWKRSATPLGRSWWVLSTPVRRTDATGCGSLLPTPAATSYGSNQGGAAGRTGPVRHSLESMARGGLLLPTPRVAADRASRGSMVRKGHWSAPSLGQAVELISGILPREFHSVEELTPQARRWAQEGGLLPTPTKRDWKSSAASPETMAKNSRPLNETARANGIAGTAASLLVLVEWMMGYPVGWLGPPWPPTATPSSRRSPKPSAGA